MKILVIEDEEFVRQSLEMILKRKGHTVFLYENGEGAQQYAEKLQPDLTIIDHDLGSGDKGLKIASGLIKHGYRAILTSGNEDARNASFDLGIPFIMKPNVNELLEMVDNISKQITS